MSLPPGGASLEWMTAAKKTMDKLQGKMEKLFPKEMAALLKKHPEVELITWEQFSEGGFSMTPYEFKMTKAVKGFDVKAFRKEVEQLLSPMPSSLLLSMYEHHSKITCTKNGVTSDYNEDSDLYDSGASESERSTPGKVELSDSPLGECFKEYYELRAQASGSVEKLLLDFVAKHKEEVKSLQWSQYTPGFCDGEACDFNVQTPRLLMKGSTEYISEYDDDLTKEQKKLIKEAQSLLDAIHSDVLYLCFGDHKQITATDKKVKAVTDYDHD